MTFRENTVGSVPLLDLKAQFAAIEVEVRTSIDRVLASQQFILGPEVSALEEEVARYSQCKFGIGVSSGTDALLVALLAIGIEPGDEVITTPYTFFATAGSIARLGAVPVFVDIDPLTYNIDPSGIEASITAKTKAIMPVHLFGQMADMDPIMRIAKERRLFVIEDAAQAIGSEYRGLRAGSAGHLGCFSFFPSKNLGGFGDGGMVVTNDAELAEKVKLLRGHGARPKYHHILVGGNFRLDAMQAAVLRVKLRYLDEWTNRRQSNAERYRQLLSESAPSVGLPWDASYGRHIYNQFVIRCQRREELMAFLKSKHIGSEVYYPIPMHLQECFASLGYRSGDFPFSEQAAVETMAIPIYPELTPEQQEYVAAAIADFFDQPV